MTTQSSAGFLGMNPSQTVSLIIGTGIIGGVIYIYYHPNFLAGLFTGLVKGVGRAAIETGKLVVEKLHEGGAIVNTQVNNVAKNVGNTIQKIPVVGKTVNKVATFVGLDQKSNEKSTLVVKGRRIATAGFLANPITAPAVAFVSAIRFFADNERKAKVEACKKLHGGARFKCGVTNFFGFAS